MSRSFNGTTDHIALAGAAVTTGNTKLSVGCWVNTNTQTGSGAGNGNRWVVGNFGGTAATMSFGLRYSSVNNWFEFLVSDGASFSNAAHGVDNLSVTTNKWYHLLGVYDASLAAGSRLSLYQAGVLVGNATGPTSLATTSTAVTIGSTTSDATATWSGPLAECAYWPGVALTIDEALTLARGVPTTRTRPASLQFYLPLWGLSSPEPDLTGGGRNGTLTGTAQANHAPQAPFSSRLWTPAPLIEAAPQPPRPPSPDPGPAGVPAVTFYASIDPAAQVDGIIYSSAVLLPAAEADLATPDSGLDDPVTCPYAQAAIATVLFRATAALPSNTSYVVLQGDNGDGNWFDLAWCTWTGTSGSAAFLLFAGAFTGGSVQLTRVAGTAPSPSLGSISCPLPGRIRFVGKATVGAGSSSSSARSSPSPAAAVGVEVAIRLKLLGLR